MAFARLLELASCSPESAVSAWCGVHPGMFINFPKFLCSVLFCNTISFRFRFEEQNRTTTRNLSARKLWFDRRRFGLSLFVLGALNHRRGARDSSVRVCGCGRLQPSSGRVSPRGDHTSLGTGVCGRDSVGVVGGLFVYRRRVKTKVSQRPCSGQQWESPSASAAHSWIHGFEMASSYNIQTRYVVNSRIAPHQPPPPPPPPIHTLSKSLCASTVQPFFTEAAMISSACASSSHA